MASQKPFLDVQNLTKTFGAQVIFDNISFSIAEGQKVGLIAKNGTGKSTLLSILTGKEDYDAGNIVYSNGIKVGYLEQSPTFDPNEKRARRMLQPRRQRRKDTQSETDPHTTEDCRPQPAYGTTKRRTAKKSGVS